LDINPRQKRIQKKEFPLDKFAKEVHQINKDKDVEKGPSEI
jgi:hypothetical protein